MFKEDNKRFVSSMDKALNVFVSIFGDSFYKNMATEFTYWDYGEDKMRSRYITRCSEDFELKKGVKSACLDDAKYYEQPNEVEGSVGEDDYYDNPDDPIGPVQPEFSQSEEGLRNKLR